MHLAHGLPGALGLDHQVGQLCGFQRESGIDASGRTVEGEMLFHHRCAQRHRRHGHTNAHGVIGQPHLAIEQLAQMRDRAQVAVRR
ncbi:hypothetical protein D3C73_1521360 [compost metagenome]